MANNIPLTEGTDAAGGYLVRPEYGATLLDGIRRDSAVQAAARNERVGTRQRKYAVYAGRPTVGWVDEGGAKPVTGATFSELTLNIEKLAATVIYTEELLEDAQQDPTRLINVDVVGALAYEVDAMALGVRAGAAIASGSQKYDTTLTASTNTVDYGSDGDAAAVAVSEAMAAIEANGYRPSAIVLASTFRGALRDARGPSATSAATTPVYTQGFQREPDTLYGLPILYSSNLKGPETAASASAAIPIGVVLDGAQAIMAVRQDITIRTSRDATVTDGTTDYPLFQTNSVAYLWENRTGFNVHDLNKSVAVIQIPKSS